MTDEMIDELFHIAIKNHVRLNEGIWTRLKVPIWVAERISSRGRIPDTASFVIERFLEFTVIVWGENHVDKWLGLADVSVSLKAVS